MNRVNDGLLSGIVAAAVFAVLYLVLDLGLLIALAFAAITFVVGWFLFKTKKPEVLSAEADARSALSEGRRKLDQIKSLGRTIRKPAMVVTLSGVCDNVEKILSTIASDPKKLKQANQFLTYYLDSTVKILSIYSELASKNVHDADIQTSLLKVEAMLVTIRDAFEKQLAKLLAGEVMDLDVELNLLQQTITMEGLGKNS